MGLGFPSHRGDGRVRRVGRGLALLLLPALLSLLPAPPARAVGAPLAQAEVEDLVSRCAHMVGKVRKASPLTIAVVDAEGNSLGVFHMNGSTGCRSVALSKAATAAYFSSDQGSFTTRTAAFIIQDHFPPGLRFAPAGPLYGVEFSSLGASDVNPIYFPGPSPAALCENEPGDGSPLPEGAQARVRGELGGVALFKGGLRVGGIGVDDGGDNRVTIPTGALLDPGRNYRVTHGKLARARALEKVVTAAASDYLPPRAKRAGRIHLDGFRLPFARGTKRRARGVVPVVAGVDGVWDADHPPRGAAGIPSRFVPATVAPPAGAPGPSIDGFAPSAFPVWAGTDGFLTAAEVERILWQGARRASVTRGAIRRPIGLPMQCWISVVDTRGEVLGVFRTPDATLFSYDVSVQKARTAVLFSDAQAAWSCRAVGLFAQGFYPAGQQHKGTAGPVHQLQDGLSVALVTGALGSPADPLLRNGITVFPGGVPLYRDGVLVGGVGVSGDGVDQDDIVADAGSEGFRAPGSIRCDLLGEGGLRASLGRALDRVEALVPAGPPPDPTAQAGLDFLQGRIARCRQRLSRMDLAVPPSFVKFPRHPGPVTR